MDTQYDYQMPAYTTLLVTDLHHSTRWYCDILGFSLISQMPGPNGQPFVSHLRWAPHADIMLIEENHTHPAPLTKGTGVTLNFSALRESVDAIATRARKHNELQISGQHNRPWNTREVIIIDPNGYRLNFTEPLREALPNEDLMTQLTQWLEEGALN
jgi:lactoylglutathione lyase